MNRWSISPPSDEAIYSLGAWIGFGLIAAGVLLGITTANTPFNGGQPWATLYLALPFMLLGTFVLVLRARVLGLSRGWIAPVAVAMVLVVLAQAYRASEVAMFAGGLDKGAWGFLTVVVNHLPYLALLAIIGANSRTAGLLGVGAAGIHAVLAVALGLHVADEDPVRSATWRFLGQVDGTLSRSFVLLLPSLLLIGVDRGRLATTGLAVAGIVAVALTPCGFEVRCRSTRPGFLCSNCTAFLVARCLWLWLRRSASGSKASAPCS